MKGKTECEKGGKKKGGKRKEKGRRMERVDMGGQRSRIRGRVSCQFRSLNKG